MEAFTIGDIISRQQASGRAYLEFLRAPELSMGLYSLPAGAEDPRTPHTEGEVYYLIEGAGSFRAAAEDRPVKKGDILYVQAGVEHRFHTITEEMKILVFFAPAEGSLGGPSS